MMERTYGLGESTATSYHAYGQQAYGQFVIIRMFPKKLCAHYFVMQKLNNADKMIMKVYLSHSSISMCFLISTFQTYYCRDIYKNFAIRFLLELKGRGCSHNKRDSS